VELLEFSFACGAARIQKKHVSDSLEGPFLIRIERCEPLDWIYSLSFNPIYLESELGPGKRRYLLSTSASFEEAVEFSDCLI